ALRNEKTFQTLAWTALGVVLWVGLAEAVAFGLALAGVEQVAAIGVAISPARAILAAARPALVEPAAVDFVGNNVTWYLLTSAVATVLLNAIAVWRVRIWNPSREARPAPTADASSGTIWGPEHDLDQTSDPALA